MGSLACDIVILPSEQMGQGLISLSQSLQPNGTLFTLDGERYYPHLSIYMTQLKVDDIDRVKSLLFAIASKTKVLNLQAWRYEQIMGYFDVEFRPIDVLNQLQDTVLVAINPLRNGMREKDSVRMQAATGLARDNFERFGYKYIGDLFRPHATITRFANEDGLVLAGLPNPTQFSGQFLKLGLFEMGDNGTCIREIASFNLM